MTLNISGKVLQLSHIIRLADQPLFIVELDTDKGEVFILIGKHFGKFRRIFPGTHFSLSCLKKTNCKFFNIVHADRILRTSKESKLVFLNNESVPSIPSIVKEDESRFVSLESTISATIDAQIGIYELEGGIRVILSYLKEIVAHLPGENSLLSLKVNDRLQIFNAHCMKQSDGSLILICCGKSLVRCERLLKYHRSANYDCITSDCAIIHCLHKYNIGLDFLNWLLDVQDFLKSVLAADENGFNKVTRRKWNGAKGILCQFVDNRLSTYEPQERSFLQEFMGKEHICVLQKDFGASLPLKLNEMATVFGKSTFDESTQPHRDNFWVPFVVGERDHDNFLVGFLNSTPGRNLTLQSRDERIEVVIVGPSYEAFSKVGYLVLISNFHYIRERFNIYESRVITREYILVHSNHISKLDKGISDEVRTLSDLGENSIRFSFRVTSISGLNFMGLDLNGFFVMKAFIQREANSVTTTTDEIHKEVLIRFKDSFSSLYPFLKDPCIIHGEMSPFLYSDLDFRKSMNFSWLNSMNSFMSSDVIDVPSSFKVTGIEPLDLSISADPIPKILEGSMFSRVVNIEGVVLEKHFMTPKYESQRIKIPLSCSKRGIGTPGSKQIRLLIADKKSPSHSICVYFSKDIQEYVSQYTLGVIPGAEVYITWLKCVISGKKAVYLTSTTFTRIQVNSVNVNKEKTSPGSAPLNALSGVAKKRYYISDLCQIPPGRVYLILATLCYVNNICFKMVCPSCKSESKNGNCTFVGCHSKDESILEAMCSIVVDDGSSTACVYLKGVDHIKRLFNIRTVQWNALNTLLQKQVISYSSKEFWQGSSQNPLQRALHCIVSNPENYRPLLLEVRSFLRQTSNFSLFGISLRSVIPQSDFSLI